MITVIRIEAKRTEEVSRLSPSAPRRSTAEAVSRSPFDLHGRVALVTGGNTGIGKGMALALAAAGADVAIIGRDPAKNRAAARSLHQFDGRVMALQCDVSDPRAVEDAIATITKTLGSLDSCFANAGVIHVNQRLIDYDEKEWRRVLAVNLDGTFYTLRAAARHMMPQGRGSICLTSSVAANYGWPGGYPYAAAKAAALALVRSAAVELARFGIRVNALMPGWTDTAMTSELASAQTAGGARLRDAMTMRVPMRRWASPGDFGGIAVYLASDASSYHTGDTFVIDGGYSIF